MHSGAEFDFIPRPYWRVHLFADVFLSLNESVPEEECQRMEEAFESFCLSTPWGALYHVVSPPPLRSAERMARRLAALLRFWEVLQGPRYAFWFDRKYTLLVEVDTEFKHREVLSDPGFLRERLAALPPEDFEDVSSAYKYTVTMQLAAWDRELGRH